MGEREGWREGGRRIRVKKGLMERNDSKKESWEEMEEREGRKGRNKSMYI